MSIVQDPPAPADEPMMEPEPSTPAPTPERGSGRWFTRIGWAFMVVGMLVGGFLVYQLWGTGIETAREQRRLGGEFEEQLAELAGIDPAAVGDDEDVFELAAEQSEIIEVADPVSGELIEVDTGERGFDEADLVAAETAAPVVVPQGTETITVRETVPTTATEVIGYEDVFVSETVPSRPTTTSNWFKVEEGQAVSRLQIPVLGVDAYVVAGTKADDIKDGPGHYPGSVLPGQIGNSVLFGHRTTHGAVFSNLDGLQPGHQMFVTLPTGDRYVYQVIGSHTIPAAEVDSALPATIEGAELTLVTCTPKYTTTNRLVVNAQLVVAESDVPWDAPPSPITQYTNIGQRAITQEVVTGSTIVEREIEVPVPDADLEQSETQTAADGGGAVFLDEPAVGTLPQDTLVTVPAEAASTVTAPSTTVAAVEDEPAAGQDDESYDVDPASGWFHDQAAWPHLVAWGALGALIIAAAMFLLRRTRRAGWPTAAKIGAGTLIVMVTVVVFLPTLYEFYVNVARLVPEGV